jgi:hypothetical protein
MRDDDDPAAGGRERHDPTSPPDDRHDDPMGPPREPCECWCMHCRRTFMSSEMWFQRVVGDPMGFRGFWMCPTPNCGGAGFTFDIFPTDPDHPANEGWTTSDDDDDETSDEGDDGELFEDDDDQDEEWDPQESKWAELDEMLGDPDHDDVEGEEWKHGLAPGERPPRQAPASWPEDERRRWEAEQRSYDEPDRRPREVDWSNRADRKQRRRPDDQSFTDDDIPF